MSDNGSPVQAPAGLAGDHQELLDELLLEKYEPIAIVGLGLRLPGGNDTPSRFAEFLRAGRCASGPIPPDRWDIDAFVSPDPDARGKVRTAGGGFVDGFDRFDSKFFNVSPREAQYLDPQQRLMLETCWEALEHANIDPTSMRHGDGGVYVGISCFDYALEVDALPYEELDAHIGTGTAHSAVPGRISYFLGWRGPSIAVDTACSSSLVALHLAVEGLRRRECEIALCGGVNAIHHPRNHIVFSEANMLAPDGVCKTFDSAADGYSRSEGCGVVVLKRLSDARRDGDRILALVRGAAVRQDGESGGLTAPNGSAQEAVMRAALASALLEPRDIQYVEAHGTGTSLGDPVEMSALRGVFSDSHRAENRLVVGSLKTNVGHMEAAAGIGGVLKTVLQLHHGELYPHLHLDSPSEHIPWDRWPVTVPTIPSSWDAPTRRAIVNSFGFAGTIATVVLEETPPALRLEPNGDGSEESDGQAHVVTLSARSRASLCGQIERYQQFLSDEQGASLADICYTSNVGRAHLGVRIAGAVSDRAELATFLDQRLAQAREEDGSPGRDVRKIALLFTGQGSQYPGMGAPLYARYPAFRRALDDCDQLFAPHLGLSVARLLLDSSDGSEAIHETVHTQPALFSLEYAAAMLLRGWGIEPDVLIGHSIGEVAAAAVAGLFSLEDATRLVAARARLMQSVSAPGGMVSVMAPPQDVAALVDEHDDLAFAGFNAPEICVVSGGERSLASVVEELGEQGIRTKRLPVSHAFHSPLMAEVFDAFHEAIADVTFHEPDLTLVSNVTGGVADLATLATPGYWVRHIGAPVRFLEGMRTIAARGPHAFVEVGPTPTLCGLGKRCTDAREHLWLSTMHPSDEDGGVIRKALVKLYSAGFRIDWSGYHQGRRHRKVDLPTYAFDRRRYWLPVKGPRHLRGAVVDATTVHHPLLGPEVSTPEQREAGVREFSTPLGPLQPAYLQDHAVMDQVIFPGAGYVEVMLAAQDAVFGETGRPLLDIRISEPLILDAEQRTELRTRLRPRADGGADVEIASRVEGGTGIERNHVTGVIAADPAPGQARDGAGQGLGPAGGEYLPDELYSGFADRGLRYGPEFRRIERLTRHGDGVAVGELRGSAAGAVGHLHPAILDAALQCLAGVVDSEDTHLPVGFERVRLHRKPRGEHLRGVLRLREEAGDGDLRADIELLDGDRLVLTVDGLVVHRVASTAAPRRLYHEPRWVKRSLVQQAAGDARHVLVVNRPEQDLGDVAGPAARSGVRLSFACDEESLAGALGDRPTDVCWFWRSEPGDLDLSRLRSESERNYRDLLALVRALEEARFGRDQRLWLVTAGAQSLPGDAAADGSLAAATLWGFGQTLWSEYPAYSVTLLDLPPGGGDPRVLLDEVQAREADEFLVAYRDGCRHVRRIVAVEPGSEETGNVELAITDFGDFAGVRPVPADDVAPTGDEIQVRVHAAGLNFKDVLNALGLLKEHADALGIPYQPLPLGFECSGTVLAAGPEAGFAPGDEVVVSHLGCMRRRVTVPSAAAVRKPENLSFAQAAGLPSAYVTASYALRQLAGLQAGDRVLIHAAAGGVGQAAVHLAKLAGAEVFATASPRKWPLLRAQGVEHVMNSRTLDFADEVMRLTGGEGVDVVLNSLNKEHIAASVRVLATGGRFVELGKIGVWTPEEMRAARPDAAYHNFDLSEFDQDELVRLNKSILTSVVELLARQDLAPLPTTSYSLDEVEEAFGVLSRGGNVGKLVISFVDEAAPAAHPVAVRPDETYLITGGLGALGIVTAEKLVALGARHLALTSRRALPDEDVARLEARLGDGVEVTVLQADIADPDDVGRMIGALERSEHPLGGIVHAAGVLADRPVADLSWQDVEAVFRSKVYGTWLLHEATAAFPHLQFFVGYSSVASVLGPVAQANYAAANAFVDNLMHWRARQGLPALSINWGPWAEVGMAAELGSDHIAGIEAQGLRFLRPGDGTRALFKVLPEPLAQVMVGEFDWERFAGGHQASNALYSQVARDDGGRERIDLDELLALPRGERRGRVNEYIRSVIAQLLHYDGSGDVEPDARLGELGLDSLVAVVLKNTLEASFQLSLPTSVALDYPSVDLLTAHIDEQLVPQHGAGTTAGDDLHAADLHAADLHDIEALSDDEADAALAALREL